MKVCSCILAGTSACDSCGGGTAAYTDKDRWMNIAEEEAAWKTRSYSVAEIKEYLESHLMPSTHGAECLEDLDYNGGLLKAIEGLGKMGEMK